MTISELVMRQIIDSLTVIIVVASISITLITIVKTIRGGKK
jgi:hypothetical protein